MPVAQTACGRPPRCASSKVEPCPPEMLDRSLVKSKSAGAAMAHSARGTENPDSPAPQPWHRSSESCTHERSIKYIYLTPTEHIRAWNVRRHAILPACEPIRKCDCRDHVCECASDAHTSYAHIPVLVWLGYGRRPALCRPSSWGRKNGSEIRRRSSETLTESASRRRKAVATVRAEAKGLDMRTTHAGASRLRDAATVVTTFRGFARA